AKLSPRLVEGFGWRGALQILGILIILLALPLAYFVRDAPPTNPENLENPENRANRRTPLTPLGGVFSSHAFYLLAIGSMCSIGAVGATNQNLKLYLSLDQKYTQDAAASVISAVLAFSIGGRLLMGWLADRWPRRRVMLLIYAMIAAAIPLLFLAESPTAMYVFAGVFGL